MIRWLLLVSIDAVLASEAEQGPAMTLRERKRGVRAVWPSDEEGKAICG